MGGEGSMMAANNSLKNNRNLVAKRKEKKALSGSYANLKLAKFPKATPEQLERIKKKIQSDNRQLRRKQIVIFGIIIVIIVSFIFYFKS
ncbi:hypothetical protein GCM10007962_21720 [Yeosuana aromativorans]|uniref:Uncharacterized protein n=1 Tax=Yeosuana aromativorans TaxID=288019 RepID=A0A8J3BPR9_9FLAO|nr:hypothetical protein [Yeosuana aromativorans]GGK27109.1 hypothetical protein GCM10007962_21720 [Yeosuana aromativorans]